MSPRNSIARGVLAVLILAGFTFAPTVRGDEPADQPHLLYRLYKDHISVTDGDRCVMIPSCSAYAAQAFKKHGFAIGWIMTCDRLVRCGRDEVRLSPKKMVNGRPHVYDPVAANDFWWFKPDESDK